MVYLAQNRGFLHNGNVKVTLTLDDDLVKKVRKIAAERDTTFTGMVRDYLEKMAAVEAASGRTRRERADLEVRSWLPGRRGARSPSCCVERRLDISWPEKPRCLSAQQTDSPRHERRW